MITFRKAAIFFGTGAGIAAYYYRKFRENKTEVYTSWTNSEKAVNPHAVFDTNWDYRDPKNILSPVDGNRNDTDLEKNKPKFYRNLIFIRHGQYLDEGELDETHSLTKCGRIQAEYTGQRLHEIGIKWDKVVVSTMTRAKETADIILQQIDFDLAKVKYCCMLKEGVPCLPNPAFGLNNIEEHHIFRDSARIEAAFRHYFHRAYPKEDHDSYTLFVAHGNVIRYFVCRALQLPPEAWRRISLNHASITWFRISPDGNIQLKCLGDSGFMPSEFITKEVPRPNKQIVA